MARSISHATVSKWLLQLSLKLTCLGDLLVKKAREGVRVCMLVWDDKSSLNSNIMGGSGMMATHDEDTRKFFANTGVRIHHLLCLPCTLVHT